MNPWSAIIWGTSLLHILWAGVLWLHPDVALITAISATHIAAGQIFSDAHTYLAVTYVVFAITAVFAEYRIGWLLAFPQQILISMSAIGSIVAMYTGMYPDGYEPASGNWFIVTDQAPIVLLSMFHFIAVWKTRRV